MARAWAAVNEYTSPNVIDGEKDTVVVFLPEHLDLDEHYETTVSHFHYVRGAARGRYRIRYLCFDAIRSISPAAALILASEVDHWRKRRARRLRARVQHWDEQIKRLLCEMGYFELLGLPRPIGPNPAADVTFLRFEQGSAELRDKGKLARELRVQVEQLVGSTIRKNSFFQAISEAMVNVGQHAYPDPGLEPSRKCWWQSASYDRRTGMLTVMFYDHGIGIPRTLTAERFMERVRSHFDRWTDSVKIKAATKYGRTSTGRGERGKGLRDGQAFATAYPAGHFAIYSGRGLYRVQHRGNDVVRTKRDHTHSINGTLFEWSVKV